jgi:hypothetical protein
MWPDGGSHSQPIHLLRQASIRQIALQIPAFRNTEGPSKAHSGEVPPHET